MEYIKCNNDIFCDHASDGDEIQSQQLDHDLSLTDDRIYVPIYNKVDDVRLNVDINEDIYLKLGNEHIVNNTDNFKDALLCSLYSQVDFLRKEIEEKNILIKALTIRDTEVFCGVFDKVWTPNIDVNSDLNQDYAPIKTNYDEDDESLYFEHHINATKSKHDVDELLDDFASTDELNCTYVIRNNSTIISNEISTEQDSDDVVMSMEMSVNSHTVSSDDDRERKRQKWLVEQLLLIREAKHQNYLHEKVTAGINPVNAQHRNTSSQGEDNLQRVSSLNESDFNSSTGYEPTLPVTSNMHFINQESYDANSYSASMAEIIHSTNEDSTTDLIMPWPEGTVCILGDSQLTGLDERRLSKYRKVKVRLERGAVIEDMFDHANAVLRRKPSYIILHIGTNNAISQDYISIVNGIIRLKRYIETKLESCKVIVSSLFMRNDNHTANNTITRVNALLQEMSFDIVNNDNINDVHLGKRGLHLNKRGLGRFALNLISHIRCL